ncbi:hypothetical protein M3Y97_01168600 [Aphelenchoides bicaudatus]|nr:hypothetical protein M3Y97_01168600 [Aphelenchoides bicaudatus]
MSDNSTQSFDGFVKTLQPEWNKLSSDAKNELTTKVGNIGALFGKTPKQLEFHNLKQVPKDRLDAYIAYYKDTTARQEDRIRVAAKMHDKDPDLFEFAKAFFDDEVQKFDGSDRIREFLKHFYNRVDKMTSDSNEEFDLFVKDVNAGWNHLDVETKLLFISHFGFYDDIIKVQ